MKQRLLIGALLAGFLAVPAIVYASNSNIFCYLFPKYSIEWYALGCQYTESGEGSEG